MGESFSFSRSAYGDLLKDEELKLRVIALEDKLKNSVLIPKPKDGSKKSGRDF